MIGRTLAHYEVLSKLGEGGMGAVYLARDTKLGREVALKVLPDHFAKDNERLARFHREARTLAALNHPTIASIHGLESDDGLHFLVMERAPGEDLSERIERGPVPPEEAIAIARQIAQGLEAAHAAGIIHRDLKPANVKLSDEGKVKVLDFGLARAFQGESTAEEETLNSPTITAAMTGVGVILGTAAYMSPEQARGTTVDRRSDIWSFGVVLLEMLTGKRVFQGDTISDTLASILKSDPPWDSLPEDTPDSLRVLLARCLERDRTQRLQDIGEARIMLSDGGANSFLTGLSLARGPLADDPVAAPSGRRPLVFAAVALLIGLVAGGALIRSLTPESPTPPRRWLEVSLPQSSENPAQAPAISPDGVMAVYVLNERLWLRRFDTGTTQELPGTESAEFPFWSPDSREVGYFQGADLMRLTVAGGAPATVCELSGGDRGAGGTWSDDDRILFTVGDGKGVLQVPSRGGVPTAYMVPDSSRVQDVHDPHLIGGERGLLYSAHMAGGSFTQLYHFLAGQETLIFDGGNDNIQNPVYSDNGQVLFRKDGPNAGIWAIGYDPESRLVAGEPFLVVGEGQWPSVTHEQTLLCTTGSGVVNWQLVRCNRNGQVEAEYGESQTADPFFALDPGGQRMILSLRDGGNHQLWMLDLTRGTQSRLTFDDNTYQAMCWSADGMFIFASGSESGGPASFDLHRLSVEGLVPPQVLTKGHFPALTPDGSAVLLTRLSETNSWDQFALDLSAPGGAQSPLELGAEPTVVAGGSGWQYGGVVSPDGSLVAYVSRETGRDEVYLRRYPQGDQKRQVSVDGGGWPQWGGTGERLYFMSGRDLVEVVVETEPAVRLGALTTLFARERGADQLGTGWPLYFQVSPDEAGFYMLYQADEEGGNLPLLVIDNWAAE
ncbi:MAG: protein kinase [Candidatus Krumholzibacteria bacterium]|nr:protein kinase [Candidatus Krumholzibacteria bacterium]